MWLATKSSCCLNIYSVNVVAWSIEHSKDRRLTIVYAVYHYILTNNQLPATQSGKHLVLM